jgi:hypothetical protein
LAQTSILDVYTLPKGEHRETLYEPIDTDDRAY